MPAVNNIDAALGVLRNIVHHPEGHAAYSMWPGDLFGILSRHAGHYDIDPCQRLAQARGQLGSVNIFTMLLLRQPKGRGHMILPVAGGCACSGGSLCLSARLRAGCESHVKTEIRYVKSQSPSS